MVKYSLFLGYVLHLELRSAGGKTFFSETGYRSHFFGMVDKNEIHEANKMIEETTDIEMIDIIKELFPVKKFDGQLSLF